jgi:hypothetical protein
MIAAGFRLVGRLALLTASAALITAVSLLVLGGFLMTFPVLRLSPRDRRIKSAVDLTVAALALAATFKPADPA